MVKSLLMLSLFTFHCAWAQNNGQPNPGAPGQNGPEEYKTLEEGEIKSIQSYLQPFTYIEDDMRNPFIHPELAIPLKPGRVYGPFLPLQEFKLSQLRVNGLFWNTSRPKAIISAPNGKTYDIGIKDFIGENFGYVASIREKEVVVIQTLEDQGQRYTTTKVLFLADQAGGER